MLSGIRFGDWILLELMGVRAVGGRLEGNRGEPGGNREEPGEAGGEGPLLWAGNGYLRWEKHACRGRKEARGN